MNDTSESRFLFGTTRNVLYGIEPAIEPAVLLSCIMVADVTGRHQMIRPGPYCNRYQDRGRYKILNQSLQMQLKSCSRYTDLQCTKGAEKHGVCWGVVQSYAISPEPINMKNLLPSAPACNAILCSPHITKRRRKQAHSRRAARSRKPSDTELSDSRVRAGSSSLSLKMSKNHGENPPKLSAPQTEE